MASLKQAHASMLVRGFNSDPSSLRELIYAAAVAVSGAVWYALRLFDEIAQPDMFTWNAAIRGASQSSDPSKAVCLYGRMERMGVRPDNFTFPFLLKACTKLGWVSMGGELHCKIVKYGFGMDTFVRNSLVNFHANCGDLNVARLLFEESPAVQDVVAWSALIAGYARRGELALARGLFDEMPERDLVSWNVMMSLYAKRGRMDRARELFDQIPEKDVVSWNSMIAGYVLEGSHAQALELFEEMQVTGAQPDEVTLLSLLSACADLGALDIGQKIHASFLDRDARNLSTVLGNALIDMYSKCGSIQTAMKVFKAMKEKDVSTWNSVIGGLAFHGHVREAVHLFNKMLEGRVRPNEITFVGVLVACSHGGMVEEGHRYFNLMRGAYGITPNIRHYGCMVDMLARAGLLHEAFEFVEGMEVQPNGIIWRTLLGACRVHGNVELGERANQRLLRMRRDESGDYVLLSNIYASMGEWGGVENVRRLMDDGGVKKEVGSSLVENDARDNKELMHFLRAY